MTSHLQHLRELERERALIAGRRAQLIRGAVREIMDEAFELNGGMEFVSFTIRDGQLEPGSITVSGSQWIGWGSPDGEDGPQHAALKDIEEAMQIFADGELATEFGSNVIVRAQPGMITVEAIAETV